MCSMIGNQYRFMAVRLVVYLVVLTGGVLVAAGLGVFPWWPTIIQAVALPPFDLFHDIRVFMGESVSYPGFVLSVLIATALRAAALSWLLAGTNRRRYVQTLRFVLKFYAIALPGMLLAAGASFAGGATLYFGFFWAGMLIAALVFVLMAPMPWARSFAFWRSGAGIVAAVGYLGVQGVLGMLAHLDVAAAFVLSVAATGVFMLFMSKRFVVWRYALALPVLVFFVWLFGMAIGGPSQPRYDIALGGVQPREGSLVMMSGIDSSSGDGAIFEVDPRAFGYLCGQVHYYSYAGPGDGAPQEDAVCPIRSGAPYGPDDTYRELDELVPWFVEQVADLPEPITVITHSQGVWVVHEALTRNDAPEVDHIIYVGPFPDNWVGYPPDDARGSGVVGRGFLWLVSGIARPGGTAAFRPDQPLAETLLASPDEVESLMQRPLPDDIGALSVQSVFDLPLIQTRDLPYALDACPVPIVHPNLPYSPELHGNVRDFLDGEPVGEQCPPLYAVLGPALRPFGQPPN